MSRYAIVSNGETVGYCEWEMVGNVYQFARQPFNITEVRAGIGGWRYALGALLALAALSVAVAGIWAILTAP